MGGTLDFTVNILSSCLDAVLTFDPSILSAASIDYEITAIAPHVETLTAPYVSSSTSEPTCPTTYAFSVMNLDSSPIDTSVFTFQGSTSELAVDTSNPSKVASYPLRINVKYFQTSCSPVCSGATPCKDDISDACSTYTSGSTCAAGTTDCSTSTTENYVDAGSLDFTVNIL